MLNFFHNVNKYLEFDKNERKQLLAVCIVFAFSIGYDKVLSAETPILAITSMLTSLVISSSAVMAKELGHKLMAIKKGYTVKTRVWPAMLMINLILIMLFRGEVFIVLPVTGLLIYHHERMRIGKFFYGHNYVDNASIAFAGPLSNVYLAVFFNAFLGFNNPNVLLAMQFNLLYALISMVPADIILFFLKTNNMFEDSENKEKKDDNHDAPTSGTYMFYSTQVFYVFCVTFIAVLSAATFAFNPFAATLVAFLMAGIAFLAFWFMKGFDVS